jgi:hypothetical protein
VSLLLQMKVEGEDGAFIRVGSMDMDFQRAIFGEAEVKALVEKTEGAVCGYSMNFQYSIDGGGQIYHSDRIEILLRLAHKM